MIKKEIIAMVLAGGEGSRLKDLTFNIAKPGVSFGGKYKIIDFTLSNCSNSGIDTVGILTQYEPHLLNKHIGFGSPWDLDRMNGGVTVLQPHTKKNNEFGWYSGTANAIFQNIKYIESFNPEYVLILSGDHIYKMDYNKMLTFHKENNSDLTISVLKVPLSEASGLGILETDESLKITKFVEKPKEPKSDLASMGIYIFNWPYLKEYLLKDADDTNSSNDFGKNIIPKMLDDGKRLFAYPFKGYWKDVGTIQSFWEAHMDLINPKTEMYLFDKNWKINTRQEVLPPLYIEKDAKITNSLVEKGCEIAGEVFNSIIFPSVKIAKNAIVRNSVVMNNVTIEENVIVDMAIISNNVVIKKDCVIDGKKEIIVVGANKILENNN